MKLLILTSRFPYPLEKGDKLRLFHQLRILSEYHEVVLCALTDTDIKPCDLEKLEYYCSRIYTFRLTRLGMFWSLVKSVFSSMPAQVALFYNAKVHRDFLSVIRSEEPDHVYCQLIRTATYVRDIELMKSLDYMDNFSTWTQKLSSNFMFPVKQLLAWEAKKVAAFEEAVYRDFNTHTVISSQDRAKFTFPESRFIEIVPNGVDVNYFVPIAQSPKSYDIAFIGNLGYYNNVEAAKYLVKEIMPLVWKSNSKYKVLLAGARPSDEVLKLESPQVNVSGWVEDIRQSYASAKIFVAPILLAVGLQNKILEAMAMGIPCVTTSAVNNAIGANPQVSILLADSPEEFAAQIERLTSDEILRTKLGNEGLLFVQKNYSWERAVYGLNQIISRKD